MASGSSDSGGSAGEQRLERFAAFAAAACAVAGWAALFSRLSDPARLPAGYDSDAAVPVMMSNADRLTVESLYYWSQDRFSGLPFALASLAHRATGFFWTPSALALLQAAWVAVSIAVIWRWTRDSAVTALWACALVAGPWREQLFDLRMPYAWGLPWLLLALLAWERKWTVALFAFTLLAHSANSMTGIWLFVIVVVWRERWQSIAAVALAIGLELALRGILQVRYRDVHGFSVATKTAVVLQGFWEHYREAFSHFSFLWLAVIAVVLIRRENPRWLKALAICVALNVALPPLVRHIQDNGIVARYFTLAGLIAPFIAGAALMQWRRLAFVLPLALFVAVGPAFQSVPSDPGWAVNLGIARQLAAIHPGTFLSSGYWETYTLSSLVPNGALPAIARPNQTQRTPFLYPALGDTVWVGNSGSDSNARIDFTPHVQVGRDLFVPAGEDVTLEGREYRLYRRVSVAARARGEACVDRPLVVPPNGATALVAFTKHGDELTGSDAFEVRPDAGCADVQAFAFTP